MNHGLKYVLDCLRRSADNSACWPVYPAEAGAILSEFDRLQKENEELRGERAAAVAWLRREMQPCSGPVRATLAFAANSIEEGKHLRKEEP